MQENKYSTSYISPIVIKQHYALYLIPFNLVATFPLTNIYCTAVEIKLLFDPVVCVRHIITNVSNIQYVPDTNYLAIICKKFLL